MRRAPSRFAQDYARSQLRVAELQAILQHDGARAYLQDMIAEACPILDLARKGKLKAEDDV